jgi:ubiquinone/menaquinone biosynthesis C-methylase UbiE
VADRSVALPTVDPAVSPSLFDQVPAVYAFWREHLFRDDTERIVATLWPDGRPPAGATFLELGCGPGFYTRRLAGRFPGLQAIGLDRSIAQLERARARLGAMSLSNCRFDLGDAARLPYPAASIDGVVSARLLGTLETRDQVLAEVHRVLRPGGRCFVAEPRFRLRAALPVAVMWLAARIGGGGRATTGSTAGATIEVMDAAAFTALVRGQPWHRVALWIDGAYQYAVLEKGRHAG